MRLVSYHAATFRNLAYFVFSDSLRTVKLYVAPSVGGMTGVALEAVKGDCDDCDGKELLQIVKKELEKFGQLL